MDISVILCTYNGRKVISPTIEHLTKQNVPSTITWEFILVDNASTDGTAEYTMKLWELLNSNVKLTVVYEGMPGLIYARKAGLNVAKGDVIIFCDDDNWLDENYISLAYSYMKENPNIGILGGYGDVVIDKNTKLPEWWELDGNCNNYAVGKQLKESGNANNRGYIWGAGMVSRKDILEKVFDERFPFLMTGRSGNLVLSGEDSEICSRVRILGYDLFYYSQLKYKHYMTTNRLTEEYLNKLVRGFDNVYEMQLEYKAAVMYVNIDITEKFRLFFVRYFNRIIHSKNKRKCDLYRQYNAYVFRFKGYVLPKYQVISNFIKAYC